MMGHYLAFASMLPAVVLNRSHNAFRVSQMRASQKKRSREQLPAAEADKLEEKPRRGRPSKVEKTEGAAAAAPPVTTPVTPRIEVGVR